jgi:hypothetical protein
MFKLVFALCLQILLNYFQYPELPCMEWRVKVTVLFVELPPVIITTSSCNKLERKQNSPS